MRRALLTIASEILVETDVSDRFFLAGSRTSAGMEHLIKKSNASYVSKLEEWSRLRGITLQAVTILM